MNEPHENMPEHWVGYCYAWGYADNHPNGEEQCKFKIDWAVDKNGNPVVLDGIDFVRIYTAVNQIVDGWEKSPQSYRPLKIYISRNRKKINYV